jgi:hypothetical protein
MMLFALTGCSRTLPFAPEFVPTARESLTVWEAIQGEWQVSQTQDIASSYLEYLGVLVIDGTTYTFLPSPEADDVSAVDQRLQFLFDAPEGEVRFAYVEGVQGSDPASHFDEYDTLATCTFEIGSMAPSFFIRVGEGDSLFFHSLRDELSLWSISKNFDD